MGIVLEIVLTPPHSKELLAGFDHARKMAARAAQPISSAHVLLSLFRFPNKARVLFADRALDENRIQAALLRSHALKEPIAMLDNLCQGAEAVAQNVGAQDVDCLHLVVAISRAKDSEAYRVLERTGTSLAALRTVAVATMTGGNPRHVRGFQSRRTHKAVAPSAQERRQIVAEDTQLIRSLHEATQTDAWATGPHHDGLLPHESAYEAGPLPNGPHPCDGPGDFFDDRPPLDEGASDCATMDLSSQGYGMSPGTPSAQQLADAPLEDIAPTLAECGLDLTAKAHAGGLDRVIERDHELEALADVLGKRRANNPVLVGPPGVGKTAIVEGLALLWATHSGHRGNRRAPIRRIVALDTGAMVAGTSLRGSFSERLGAIKTEVANARGHLVVFIDELHTLIGAGASGEGPQDAAGELKAALARGEFPCIGATTDDEFKRYIERDPALERRFTAIQVKEPNCEQACRIVHGAIGPYQDHHGVAFSSEAINAAVLQSHRFVTERKLPDKAFAVLDLAGSRAHRRGATYVDRMDVAQVLHEWTGVPIERLAQADATRFAQAESFLAEHLVGHSHVITAVAQALRRGFAGFNVRRPMGSFLFLGPTGVGKTEMVKVLADFVFGQRDAIVRFDMSEMVEKHAVARLLGAQPGYVGYEEGGQLTEALRKRPFQIVLFDEIEKAHPEVLGLLLQVLDEGHLTDTQGRKVSFAHTVIILTSNLGAQYTLRAQNIGFGQKNNGPGTAEHAASMTEAVLQSAQEQISPELWGRLDEHLVFMPLTVDEVRQITQSQLEDKRRTMVQEHQVHMVWDDAVISYLLSHGGFSPKLGARGMRNVIAKNIEAPMADLILTGVARPACEVIVSVDDAEDGLRLRVAPQKRQNCTADAN